MRGENKTVPTLLLTLGALVGGYGRSASAAPGCPVLDGNPGEYTQAEVAEFLKSQNDGRTLKVNRGFTLPKGAVLKRILDIESPVYGPMTINLNGGKIDPPAGSDVVLIHSHKNADGSYCQLRDVTLKNGSLLGAVRVYGLGLNGQDPAVKISSLKVGHTERAQAVAPTQIILDSLTITSDGRVPLYLGPGVTYTTISNSRFTGTRSSVGLYFDGETGYNRVIGNLVDAKTNTTREIIALDGSAHNLIKGNRFTDLTSGGIFIYRNCGEGGAVRHQEPRANEIAGNEFYYKGYTGSRPAVWLGSRQTLTFNHYCNDDKGYDFGSSKDDHDFARDNLVIGNNFTERKFSEMILNKDIGNIIKDNYDKFNPLGIGNAAYRRNPGQAGFRAGADCKFSASPWFTGTGPAGNGTGAFNAAGRILPGSAGKSR